MFMKISITRTITREVDISESTFNDRIKCIRVNAGWNQKEFAGHLGLSRSQIANIETGGTHNMSIENIQKLMDRFNVNANWLIAGEGKPYKRKSGVRDD